MEGLLLLCCFGAGLIALWIVCKLLTIPVKLIWKLVINALVGALLLIVFNFFGGLLDLSIPITPVSALLTGVFGAPGVILLVLLQFIL